eukprot:8490746-Pyramimonas_sp.AAC.1
MGSRAQWSRDVADVHPGRGGVSRIRDRQTGVPTAPLSYQRRAVGVQPVAARDQAITLPVAGAVSRHLFPYCPPQGN